MLPWCHFSHCWNSFNHGVYKLWGEKNKLMENLRLLPTWNTSWTCKWINKLIDSYDIWKYSEEISSILMGGGGNYINYNIKISDWYQIWYLMVTFCANKQDFLNRPRIIKRIRKIVKWIKDKKINNYQISTVKSQ